jgi:hypothetical protein
MAVRKALMVVFGPAGSGWLANTDINTEWPASPNKVYRAQRGAPAGFPFIRCRYELAGMTTRQSCLRITCFTTISSAKRQYLIRPVPVPHSHLRSFCDGGTHADFPRFFQLFPWAAIHALPTNRA